MQEGYPDELALLDLAPETGSPLISRDEAEGFVPQGFLLGPPAVIFPYRGMAPNTLYGPQYASGNPFLDAPKEDSGGGTIYFAFSAGNDLPAILKAMGVFPNRRDYVAFAKSTHDPVGDRYLDQLRLISHGALTALYKVKKDQVPEDQSLSVGEALIGFLEAQKAKWEDGNVFSRRLSGTAGGDGDWAKETLAFGFHVENTYWGIYRIWSRSRLVTK